MTVIDVFSGLPEAGKSSLLRRLIDGAWPGERIVLMENSFGAVSMDRTLLSRRGVELAELSGGCICCGRSGDFSGKLQTLIGWESPDRVLIEPSGEARLSEICRLLRDVQSACAEYGVRIGTLTTVVDATRAASQAVQMEALFADQVSRADCLLLSRTEGMDKAALVACQAMLRRYNPQAKLLTDWEKLSPPELREQLTRRTQREKDAAWRRLPGPGTRSRQSEGTCAGGTGER